MKWLTNCCLAFFFVACQTPLPQSSKINEVLDVARGLGDALLRQKGAAELKRSVPELMPLIDKDHNEIITLEEVEAFLQGAAADPQSVGLLLGTLVLLRK